MFKITRKAEPKTEVEAVEGFTSSDVSCHAAPFIGETEAARAYALSVKDARKAMMVRYCVAPLCGVKNPGKEFGPGDEITLSDVGDLGLLRSLISKGVVLEADARELEERLKYPADSPFVTVKSLTTARGIVPPGVGIDSTWFDRPARAAKEPVPLMRHADGSPIVGTGPHSGIEGRPAVDGKDVLASLLTKGLVRYRDGQQAV